MSGAGASVATLVVGAGGMLGSAVVRALGAAPAPQALRPESLSRLHWTDAAGAREEIARRVAAFFARNDAERWNLLWCAGAGVVGVSRESLAEETDLLAALLEAVARFRPPGSRGSIFLASSAGGVYAGSPDALCDEESACCPISAYGEAKLAQERLLERWSAEQQGVSTLIGRISNLYGPGQDVRKPQGLVSQLCRSVVLGRAAHVFVPLHTRRDYLYVEDCGAMIARGLARLRTETEARGTPVHVRKILASEQPISIAAVLSVLRRIAKRPVRVVQAPLPVARLHPVSVALRSRVWPDLGPPRLTPFSVGVLRTWHHLLALQREGRLASPPASAIRAAAP